MSKEILNRETDDKNIESIVKSMKDKYNIIYDINRDFKNIEIITNKSDKQKEIIIKNLDNHILQLQKQKNLKGRDIGRIIKAKEMLNNFKNMILYGETKK